MAGFIIAMATFLAVLFILLGIYNLLTFSRLDDMMSESKPEIHLPVLDKLWTGNGLSRQDSINHAVMLTLLGGVIGIFLGTPLLALGLGILGVMFGPRITGKLLYNHFHRKFLRQYARALHRLRNAAAINPISVALVSLPAKLPDPARKVFQYIADSIENNSTPEDAVSKAAHEFRLPELLYLADTIKDINQVGGGSHALVSLDVLRKNVLKSWQFISKINSKTLENKMQILICSAMIVGITFMTYSDGGGDIISQHPGPIWLGAGILIVGNILVFYIINQAKRTM